ncbi:hypothetical protein F0562_010116 [Nyssa sinensis]|uniref:Transmembrane protein 14C n=1 Tax=Nyssa sinensis TaxID=561372 RepID=A0A5J4ZXY3_9ASTE|nr:hypothetical protein F0562_010116 [Nyssa sinensis]
MDQNSTRKQEVQVQGQFRPKNKYGQIPGFVTCTVDQRKSGTTLYTAQFVKMHDFCFTIPYGLVLLCGGIVGYARKGSTTSLAGGLGTGFLLILAGYLSLKAFHKRKNSYFALILETAWKAVFTLDNLKRRGSLAGVACARGRRKPSTIFLFMAR